MEKSQTDSKPIDTDSWTNQDANIGDTNTITNFTDFGHGHCSWDGNTYTSVSHYPTSIETVNKKMDDVLKRISVIERTLLAILNKIETVETKSDGKQV